jgi:hypothetical protein
MKKRMFVNKPSISQNYNNGHYLFFNDSENVYDNSDSVPNIMDKFDDRDLYTLQQPYNLNKHIIDGGLRYSGTSFISIDKLTIDNNGVNHDIKNVAAYVYVLDNLSVEAECDFGSNETIDNATYSQIINCIATSTDPFRSIWNIEGEFYSYQEDLGDVIKDAKFLKNLYTGGEYSSDWDTDAVSFTDPFADYIDPCFQQGTSVDGDIELLTWDGVQKIHVIVWMRGDAEISWWPDFERDDRIQVFTINPETDLIDPNSFEGGGVTQLQFGYGDSHKVDGGGNGTPAWKATDLQLTINTNKESSAESYIVDAQYNDITGSVLPPRVITNHGFYNDVLSIHPAREINSRIITEWDFIPTTDISILDNNNPLYNLQAYHEPIEDRQVTSSPNQISFNFVINKYYDPIHDMDLEPLNGTRYASEVIEELYDIFNVNLDPPNESCDSSMSQFDGIPDFFNGQCLKVDACYYAYKDYYFDYKNFCDELFNLSPTAGDTIDYTQWNVAINNKSVLSYGKPNYMFYVLSWDDKDNKFQTWDDVFNDIPSNQFELYEKQEENLYYYTNVGDIISHSYTTPGIKEAKIVMFSYRRIGLEKISPVRWKFVKSRLFLDIPVNEYPDFEEIDGSDYKTIPWSYTAPIIGGVDANSKYKISIQDTLSGGKISQSDIIDELFLIDDIKNDEMGKSINKFDLEQVRFFNNGSYDIYYQLGIDDIAFTENTFLSHTSQSYWNGETNTFSEETSVQQIFITDNVDSNLVNDCVFEINCGELLGKSILDSSGNGHKGLLIGDYKVKKIRKNVEMRRDSFIKGPKVSGNKDGAL